MDLDKKLKRVSITLSKILRHQAINMNIKIDDAGWVRLDDILKCKELKNISVADIEYVVENNNKKRFTLEIRNNITYIKANQGHSIDKVKDDLLLTELTKEHNIKYVVHGTFKKCYQSIKENGLCKMNRNHIHFAKNINVSSGIRKNAEVHIYIDVIKAMNNGIKFYESDNGVILSPGIGDKGSISSDYFQKVTFT